MVYRLIADVVVLVHLAFILFVALGGLLAWRWPRLLWFHLAAVAWGAGIVTIGWDCPLTPLEKHFRRLGGEQGYSGGFVDRYVEGVIYPERYTTLLRLLAAVAIAVGWWGLLVRRRRVVGARSDRNGGPARTRSRDAASSAPRATETVDERARVGRTTTAAPGLGPPGSTGRRRPA